ISSAIIVARLRVPGRLPAGLPEMPFAKGLPSSPCIRFAFFIAMYGCICNGFAARLSLPILAPLILSGWESANPDYHLMTLLYHNNAIVNSKTRFREAQLSGSISCAGARHDIPYQVDHRRTHRAMVE